MKLIIDDKIVSSVAIESVATLEDTQNIIDEFENLQDICNKFNIKYDINFGIIEYTFTILPQTINLPIDSLDNFISKIDLNFTYSVYLNRDNVGYNIHLNSQFSFD